MAALSAFIKQCLSEDKYGSQYVSEIEERVESMNLAQLQGMHSVLKEASRAAKVDVWRDGNDAILEHVNKWLAIRTKEYNIRKEREDEVARKFRARQQAREIHQREKENVIIQLRNNAGKQAEEEIKEYEANRKSQYKAGLYDMVDAAETKRLLVIKYGCAFLIVGCVIIGVLPIFLPFFNTIFVVIGILVVVMVACYIFFKGYQAGIVPPYDENFEGIQRAIDTRQEELFLKALNHLKETEREFERRMELDKQERRNRKAARRQKAILDATMAGSVQDEEEEREGEHTNPSFPVHGLAPGREVMQPIRESEEEAAAAEAMVTEEADGEGGGAAALPRPHSIAPSKDAGVDDVLPFDLDGKTRKKKRFVEGVGPEQDDDKSRRDSASRSDVDSQNGCSGGAQGVYFTHNRLVIKKVVLENLSEKLNCFGSDVFVSISVTGAGVGGCYMATTNAQKCVGDSLVWRLEGAPHPVSSESRGKKEKKKGRSGGEKGDKRKGDAVSSDVVVDITSSSACVITFSLCDTKSPENSDVKACVSGSDVYLTQSIVSNGVECRIVNIDLCRNDVFKMADLCVEFVMAKVANTVSGNALQGVEGDG